MEAAEATVENRKVTVFELFVCFFFLRFIKDSLEIIQFMRLTSKIKLLKDYDIN